MLEENGFNEWAKHYDKSVLQEDGYPFLGYRDLMNYIIRKMNISGANILDVGVGTGILASYLNKLGAFITGIDFSEEMIEIAKSRILQGRFYQYNLENGLPSEVNGETYHYIISTYVFHHFDLKHKVKMIKDLRRHLKKEGLLMIGDISFITQKELNRCKEKNLNEWDLDEIYFVKEELEEILSKEGISFSYEQISTYAGIYIFK